MIKIQDVVHKTLLPTYDVFDEYRYFEPAYDWHVMQFKGKKLAVTVCEDIWNLGNNPLYRICPMDKLIQQAPDLMMKRPASASPFDYTHIEDRKAIIKANVLKYKIPLLYCNAVGSQTEIVFDGGSLIFDKDSHLIKEGKYFEEDSVVGQFDEEGQVQSEILAEASTLPNSELNPSHYDATLNIDKIHDALVMGIRIIRKWVSPKPFWVLVEASIRQLH